MTLQALKEGKTYMAPLTTDSDEPCHVTTGTSSSAMGLWHWVVGCQPASGVGDVVWPMPSDVGVGDVAIRQFAEESIINNSC